MASEGLVLIVEDEDAIRLTLRDFLQKKGFTVVVGSDGVGAIKQLLDVDVKVTVTDYRMDDLGGDYWVKFLQKYCTEETIFVTSGFLRPEFDVPYEVIFKPFDYSDLSDKIAAALSET